MRSLRSTLWLLPVFLLTACAADGETPTEGLLDEYVVAGQLPTSMDLAAVVAKLPAGGFAVVGDPATGEMATITAPSSASQDASDEFDVAVAASCPDCIDPTCFSTTRTIEISLLHHTGIQGATYSVETDLSVNFSSPVTTPASWEAEIGSTVGFSTTGTLPTCAPFAHYFSVVGPDLSVSLYEQDFDTLPDAGPVTNVDFVDALPGWSFVNSNGARLVGTGSGNQGAIYSFGGSGSMERSLGGVASGGTDTQYWGFCYTNGLDDALTDLSLSFAGEQWRQANPSAHSLQVEVSVAPAVAADLDTELSADSTGNPTTGWASVTALDFVGPQFGASTGALDGNAPENRTLISGMVYDGVLDPGESLCLRWIDIDDPGSDHGLAIDDLELRGTPVSP